MENKLTLDEVLAGLEAAVSLRVENKLSFFQPYPKQMEFCNAGKFLRELLLMAGNQVGKSEAGAFKTACHLTGDYPDWWQGERWNRATRGWIAGETSLVVRDVQQKKLCGEPGVKEAFGTGMIPRDRIVGYSMARGITDAIDTIQVRHKSGGISIGRFKSYEQGRQKFQGESLDWNWCDEEPPEEVYNEILARLAEGGRVYVTFTPLKGRSKVVLRFIDEPSQDRGVISLSLAEITHFSEEEKRKRVEGYSAHERAARESGIPLLGSGAVYTFSMNMIMEPMIDFIPPQWKKLWGIDFGIGHRFGAVLGLLDADNDIWHLHHTVRMADALPLQHATAMKQVAANVPVAWPHDGHQRQQASDTADELAVVYRKHGLSMLADHATFVTGGYSREAAVMEVQERAFSGRLKVASHLSDWFQEAQLYHRKDGLIVKTEDDLMSATEKLMMMKRFARPVALGSKVAKRRAQAFADGVDQDPWGG